MDFHFIKLNHNGTYLSLVDPKSKSRFVCFSDQDMAMKCVDYAAEFRARNRIWPSLDMSSANRKLEKEDSATFPYGSPKMIKRSLEIDSFDLNTIDIIASSLCFLIAMSKYFFPSALIQSIKMSGQEMDGIANPEDFGEWMDFSLKIK